MPEKKNLNILFICVNYNTYDELNNFLRSVEQAYNQLADDTKVSFLVIDNSTDYAEIVPNYSFKLIQEKTDDNLGYFGGFQYGLKIVKDYINKYDYIVVSNADVTIDANFFCELKEVILENNVGCIAPSIYSVLENKDRNPKIVKRITLKKLKILKVLYKFPFLNLLYEKLVYPIRRKNTQKIKGGYVYAAHGSFMMFTKKSFDFLMGMEYPIFLFGEEIFVAENLMRNSLKTIYIPEIKVYDTEHASTSGLKKKSYYNYNYEAICMLIKEYFDE